MKMILFTFILVCISFNLQSQAREIKRFVIASEIHMCQGEALQECFLVKQLGDENWNDYIEYIHGFTFEKGYEYVLDLSVEKIAQPKRDESNLRYHLVKIISKEKR